MSEREEKLAQLADLLNPAADLMDYFGPPTAMKWHNDEKGWQFIAVRSEVAQQVWDCIPEVEIVEALRWRGLSEERARKGYRTLVNRLEPADVAARCERILREQGVEALRQAAGDVDSFSVAIVLAQSKMERGTR